jgi:hypothetical protein
VIAVEVLRIGRQHLEVRELDVGAVEVRWR